MKLTTTRHLIYFHTNYVTRPSLLTVRFDRAYYPNIDPDQEVSLLDMLNNGINTVHDVIWCLRATKQDSKPVSVALAKRCADRKSLDLGCGYAAIYCTALVNDGDMIWAAEVAEDILNLPYAVSDREKQKQDLLEFLS
jgi:hypothetical protein